MDKRQELYAGKAKSVYATDDPDRLILHFRDDTSAFDGERMESLARKGKVNNRFNAFIMEKLQAAGIPTHYERLLSDTESVVKKLDMLPVECVIRNIAAGGWSSAWAWKRAVSWRRPLSSCSSRTMPCTIR
ncbi:phosphoribosylaminoimidazole-succinocarboxamide synthase [Halomonas elongata]|uniref:phosphoribosylaminoimidazolesuccinocarboxamide synthase n=1 Tax=Halomonas elongata TaxID=2746 RepID=A0A1B8NW86_HALEL|nr:phosphoribosylaminoimidazole-succinocarboxamide synthase [Halomonas elongata]